MIVLGLVLMLIGFCGKNPSLVVPGDSGRPDRARPSYLSDPLVGRSGAVPLALNEVPIFFVRQ